MVEGRQCASKPPTYVPDYCVYSQSDDMYYQTLDMSCGPTTATNMLRLLNNVQGELNATVLKGIAVDSWKGYEDTDVSYEHYEHTAVPTVDCAMNENGYYGYGFEEAINKRLSIPGKIQWNYVSPKEASKQSSSSKPAMLVVGNADLSTQHWTLAVGEEFRKGENYAKFIDPAKGVVWVIFSEVEEGRYEVGLNKIFKKNGAYQLVIE